MKLSEQWLREWVNPPISTDELVKQLTLAGLEVDNIHAVAANFSHVVIGHVLEVQQHPDADRLRVCLVDVGEDAPLNIVCGAPNVRKDLKVAVAKIGAVLPGDFKIKKSKLRGVESEGMICSQSELGMIETQSGIMELASEAPIGEDLRKYLQLEDVIIDINVTPNRGDCLSVLGIAREVAAVNNNLSDSELKLARYIKENYIGCVAPSLSEKLTIAIRDKQACPHYIGRIIRGINPHAKTPSWMQEKLLRSDIRPISPVVDATNFVLLELGQPLHAFDLNQLSGDIEVRFANENEKLTLLEDQEIVLGQEQLVITSGGKPIALAGIKGGSETSISTATTDIFLESALFNPSVISKSTRKYGLFTDSSHRYERGVDFALQRQAIELASRLILEIAGGQAAEIIEVGQEQSVKSPILLRKARVMAILGIELPEQAVINILKNLSMDIKAISSGWEVRAPSFRHDINAEIDLIEEIARVYGYDKIPLKPVTTEIKFSPASETKLDILEVKRSLVTRGYQEAITYSFVDPYFEQLLQLQAKPLVLLNPIASDLSTMRTNHWAGLLKAFQHNVDRQQARVRLFEVGLCFLNQGESLQQILRLGGLCSGSLYKEQWGKSKRNLDFFDVKSDIENILALTRRPEDFKFEAFEHPALHPGKSAVIYSKEEQVVGYLGALHPSIAQKLEINQPLYLFDLNLESIMFLSLPAYAAISKFPAIRRDIALVVAINVAGERIREKILASGGELLKNVQIFDVYQGKGIDSGKKSIALSLTFQHTSRTLIDAEINDFMQRILDVLHRDFNATLRD